MSRTDADLLDRLMDGGDPDEAPRAVRSLVVLATTLAEAPPAPAARPDPGFRNALRARLLEVEPDVAATEDTVPLALREPPLRRPQRTRWSGPVARPLRLAVIALAGLLLLTGGVAVAAESAGPASPLYGVKLALVDARLALERGQDERGLQRLATVDERLTEAERAVAAGQDVAAARALRAADDGTRRGVSELLSGTPGTAALPTVESWAPVRAERVRALLPAAGAPARDAGRAYLLSLARVDELVQRLRGDCPGAAGVPADLTVPPPEEPFDPCPGGPPEAPGAQVPSVVGPTPSPSPSPVPGADGGAGGVVPSPSRGGDEAGRRPGGTAGGTPEVAAPAAPEAPAAPAPQRSRRPGVPAPAPAPAPAPPPRQAPTPAPGQPEAPTDPQEPDVPAVPEEPDVPAVPEEPDVPAVPEEPEAPAAPEAPGTEQPLPTTPPEVPPAPRPVDPPITVPSPAPPAVPDAPDLPVDPPEVPDVPEELPEVPREIPDTPEVPDEVPESPSEAPDVVPDTPTVPEVPREIPDTPDLPLG